MMMACPWQVWADPLGVAPKPEQGLAQRQSQQEWRGHTSTAWQIDPQLALALVDRFPSYQPIQAALQALVTSGASAIGTQVPPSTLPPLIDVTDCHAALPLMAKCETSVRCAHTDDSPPLQGIAEYFRDCEGLPQEAHPEFLWVQAGLVYLPGHPMRKSPHVICATQTCCKLSPGQPVMPKLLMLQQAFTHCVLFCMFWHSACRSPTTMVRLPSVASAGSQTQLAQTSEF